MVWTDVAVVSLDAELRAQRVGEAQDAVTVLSPRAVVIAVVEPHAVGEAGQRGQDLAVIHELLHTRKGSGGCHMPYTEP